MTKKKQKKLSAEAKREKRRKYVREWRQRYYDRGYTYVKRNGKWGWAKKKGRKPARIHPED
jgi:hypothetical protein